MLKNKKEIIQKSSIPTGVRILLAFISVLFANNLFQILGYLILGLDISDYGLSDEFSLQEHAILQAFGMTGSLLVIFSFRRYCDLGSIFSMGFSLKNNSKDLFLGFLAAVVIISLSTIIFIVRKNITITGFKFDSNNFSYGFLLFTVVAFNEEILCRGYILNNLMGVMNKYLALAISSVIFALMHSFNSNLSLFGMLNLFIAGILLGSTYIYTKNLWFPISFHLFWNFIQGCVFDYNVSGLNLNSIFKFDMPIKNSFNGGDFGFEGSWLCTLLCSCTILIILYSCNRKSNPVHIHQTANI